MVRVLSSFIQLDSSVWRCQIQISCGLQHNVALSHDGSVFCWGRGHKGQLGVGALEEGFLTLARRVPALEGMIGVAAGLHFTAAWGTEQAFLWGNNNWGQCGVSPTSVANSCVASPHPLITDSMPTIGEIGALQLAFDHVLLCSKHPTKVFAWGRGSNGQLGAGEFHELRAQPRDAVSFTTDSR